jgi:hypothetical protein
MAEQVTVIQPLEQPFFTLAVAVVYQAELVGLGAVEMPLLAAVLTEAVVEAALLLVVLAL